MTSSEADPIVPLATAGGGRNQGKTVFAEFYSHTGRLAVHQHAVWDRTPPGAREPACPVHSNRRTHVRGRCMTGPVRRSVQAAVKDYQKKRAAGKSPQAAMAEVQQEQQAAATA